MQPRNDSNGGNGNGVGGNNDVGSGSDDDDDDDDDGNDGEASLSALDGGCGGCTLLDGPLLLESSDDCGPVDGDDVSERGGVGRSTL